MSRITECFTSLAGKKALIPFITAGDPHPNMTVELMHHMVEGGADIIELGVPFSDPIADGPIIQHASERALAHNVSLRDVLTMVESFRKINRKTPVVLMGYLNPIHTMGFGTFAKIAGEAGLDGVLTVDCPPEEISDLAVALEKERLDPIFLLAPTTPDERIAEIIKYARGYIYYVSLKGVTGATTLDINQVASKMKNLRQYTQLPVGIGFGIQDTDTAYQISKISDAIVIGSHFVQSIASSPPEKIQPHLTKLIREFKTAINR